MAGGISMTRGDSSIWPVVRSFHQTQQQPADVDFDVSVAREVAEDRGPFCGAGDGSGFVAASRAVRAL